MTSKEAFKETKQIILNNAKKGFIKDFVILDNDLNIIEKDLDRLEQIDNANPSEALKSLKKSLNMAFGFGVQSTLDELLSRGYNTKDMLEKECLGNSLKEDLDKAKIRITNIYSIQQSLLKVQKQDKVLKILNEYKETIKERIEKLEEHKKHEYDLQNFSEYFKAIGSLEVYKIVLSVLSEVLDNGN